MAESRQQSGVCYVSAELPCSLVEGGGLREPLLGVLSLSLCHGTSARQQRDRVTLKFAGAGHLWASSFVQGVCELDYLPYTVAGEYFERFRMSIRQLQEADGPFGNFRLYCPTIQARGVWVFVTSHVPRRWSTLGDCMVWTLGTSALRSCVNEGSRRLGRSCEFVTSMSALQQFHFALSEAFEVLARKCND